MKINDCVYGEFEITESVLINSLALPKKEFLEKQKKEFLGVLYVGVVAR